MNLTGEGSDTDESGRALVAGLPVTGHSEIVPPDTVVVDPDGQLLARISYDASPEHTIDVLKETLTKRPDLAPDSDGDPFEVAAPTTQAEHELRALKQRYDSSTRPWEPQAPQTDTFIVENDHLGRLPGVAPGEIRVADQTKAALVGDLQAWIERHGSERSDADAWARVLLGGALANAGFFEQASATWAEMVELYPNHPLRHRAAFNLLEPDSSPRLPHPEIEGVARPFVPAGALEVPDPGRRAANLAAIEADSRYLKLREGLPFVRIPAGTFTMGGTPATQSRQLPTRQVTISRPFLISAWPITRKVWRLFREQDYPASACEGDAGDLPVAGMTWRRAREFCEFLSALDGRRYRLPTEAEWEYAARGGLDSAMYPWGNEPQTTDRLNYDCPRPRLVASYAPNGYGLFELVGNGGEWVEDRYLGNAYALTEPEVTDPKGPTLEEQQARGQDTSLRVLRGGVFLGNEVARVVSHNAWRIGLPDSYGWSNLGARLVVDLDD